MEHTRRSLLKAFPLALGGGLVAVPVLQAFNAEDLKEAQKGELLKTEPTVLKPYTQSNLRVLQGPMPTLGTHSGLVGDQTHEIWIESISYGPAEEIVVRCRRVSPYVPNNINLMKYVRSYYENDIFLI